MIAQSQSGNLGASRAEVIRGFNDTLRTKAKGGRIGLTPRVAALPPNDLATVCRAVKNYSGFTADSDPFGEHDFGSVLIDGRFTIAWKIDAYDHSLTKHSPDATDPVVTTRVMTIMMGDEY